MEIGEIVEIGERVVETPTPSKTPAAPEPQKAPPKREREPA